MAASRMVGNDGPEGMLELRLEGNEGKDSIEKLALFQRDTFPRLGFLFPICPPPRISKRDLFATQGFARSMLGPSANQASPCSQAFGPCATSGLIKS